MRKFETFFIVDPDLPDDINAAVDSKVQSIVSANGGEVLSYNPWGKRKLAYPIRKRTRGLYVLMEYSGGPELIAELERNMRIDERILKFITIKLEQRFDAEKEKARREAAVAAFNEEEESATAAPAEGEEEEMPEDFGEVSLKEEEEE